VTKFDFDRPTNLEDWARQEFSPVPIKLHIEPLSNLITELNFSPSDDYAVPNGINVTYVVDLFNNLNANFCRNVLNLTEDQCTKKDKGEHIRVRFIANAWLTHAVSSQVVESAEIVAFTSAKMTSTKTMDTLVVFFYY